MKYQQAKRLAMCSGNSPKYEIGNSQYTIERQYPIYDDKIWRIDHRFYLVRDKEDLATKFIYYDIS